MSCLGERRRSDYGSTRPLRLRLKPCRRFLSADLKQSWTPLSRGGRAASDVPQRDAVSLIGGTYIGSNPRSFGTSRDAHHVDP